ncbi:uncharacterized protein IL334_003980 [Kwoniella shivajii]|uniref:Thioredoxin domain-containing protein n=1 Tax=Kwoniella shivajii TaxID=564305 RepID=A0ABZ1CZ31_9TREE|nr:hypothetical protein IL334_003980 [Kwoniella shivajii]
MSSNDQSPSGVRVHADRPLTPEELEAAFKVNIVDKDGNSCTLGDVVSGKRVLIVFIRHFWCANCQIYTYQLGQSIPPSSLPQGTEIIIIGCGSSSPISHYAEIVSSPYPIYSCPSLELHKIFQFVSTLSGSISGDDNKKDYTSSLGGIIPRTWFTLKKNFWNNPLHGSEKERGPMKQNGGEVIVERDGTCSFIHRMQNTEDHTNIDQLANHIEAKYIPLSEKAKTWPYAN